MPCALDKRAVLLEVVFVLLRQLHLHVHQVARPLREEPLHPSCTPRLSSAGSEPLFPEPFPGRYQDVGTSFVRSKYVSWCGSAVTCPPMMSSITSETSPFSCMENTEHCDDHLPWVVDMVVTRRLTGCLLVSGAHACPVFVFLGDKARQLHHLLAGGAGGATQTILPESIRFVHV